MSHRNPLWSSEFTNRKPAFGNRGALRLNPNHRLNQGLVAWWLMNERGGNIIHNLVAGKRSQPFVGTSPPVWSGDGLLFSNGYIPLVPSGGDPYYALGSGPFSFFIDFDVYYVGSEMRYVFEWFDLPGWNASAYIAAWSDDVTFWLRINYSSIYLTDSTVEVGRHRYVLTRSGSLFSLYRDGRFVVSSSLAGSLGTSNTFNIGANWGGFYSFTRNIYGFAQYNRCLSDVEVGQLCAFPYGTPDSPRFLVEPRRIWFVPTARRERRLIAPLPLWYRS